MLYTEHHCNPVTTADPDDPDSNPGQTGILPRLIKTAYMLRFGYPTIQSAKLSTRVAIGKLNN